MTPQKKNSAGDLAQTQAAIWTISATLPEQFPTAGHQRRQFHPKSPRLGDCYPSNIPAGKSKIVLPSVREEGGDQRPQGTRTSLNPQFWLQPAPVTLLPPPTSFSKLLQGQVGVQAFARPTLDNGSGALKTSLQERQGVRAGSRKSCQGQEARIKQGSIPEGGRGTGALSAASE